MKKLLALSLAGMMIFSLAGCGSRADEQYVANWIASIGLDGDKELKYNDVSGYGLELLEKGKGTMTVDKVESEITWENDDTTLTVKKDKESYVATIGAGYLEFADFGGTGVKYYLAIEGSDIAEEMGKFYKEQLDYLGTWKSFKVEDAFDKDISAEVDPEGFEITFNPTTVDVKLGDETFTCEIGVFSYEDGDASNDDYKLYWDTVDGGVDVQVTANGETVFYTCKKQ